jgi:predicted PurR-regulated permease PerM
MNNEKILDISWNSIFKVIFVLFSIYLLSLLGDILIWIITALIISILFNPVIDFLQKIRFPRILAAGFAYLLFFGILGLFFYFITSPLVAETNQFIKSFPQYFEIFAPYLQFLGYEIKDFETFIRALQEWLINASANIFVILSAFFGGIFAAFTIFSIAFFFSLEERWTEKVIKLIFPKKYEDLAFDVWERSQRKISAWFGIRILGCIFVGLSSFLVLKLLGIDYAFSLGLLAGITNIIPILGPIIAGILIAFLVLFEDWIKAIIVLTAFILIQQIEGSILTPVLSKKLIGLPPALVLISLIIGGKLWGFLGAILAIPLAGILFEFLKEFFQKNKERRERKEREEDAVIL